MLLRERPFVAPARRGQHVYGYLMVKPTLLPTFPTDPVQWMVSRIPVDYPAAVAAMEARAAAIAAGEAPELAWLVEHPPLYTAGTGAQDGDLLDAGRFPVFRTGRGGQFTYHGPGQRVVYLMLDLNRRRPDLRLYVQALEEWIVDSLARFTVRGERRPSPLVGVWVPRPEGGEDKIAAVGVRVRKWVTFHGISLNVEPDLSHYDGIVPCGVRGPGVTSLVALGRPVTMDDADEALLGAFSEIFGPVEPVAGEPLELAAHREAIPAEA